MLRFLRVKSSILIFLQRRLHFFLSGNLDAYVFIFYRTQVSLGSDLWVMISLTPYKTICRLKGEVRQKKIIGSKFLSDPN